MAQVAIQELSWVQQRTVPYNVRAVSCLFLHRLMLTWAASFTWLSGKGARSGEDSASWLPGHHKHFSNIYKAVHLSERPGDKHSSRNSLTSLQLHIPAHRASLTNLPEHLDPICITVPPWSLLCTTRAECSKGNAGLFSFRLLVQITYCGNEHT